MCTGRPEACTNDVICWPKLYVFTPSDPFRVILNWGLLRNPNNGEVDRPSKTTSFKCFVCKWALYYECFRLSHADTPSFDTSNRFTDSAGRPWR